MKEKNNNNKFTIDYPYSFDQSDYEDEELADWN